MAFGKYLGADGGDETETGCPYRRNRLVPCGAMLAVGVAVAIVLSTVPLLYRR
jgi:hypothetical protein